MLKLKNIILMIFLSVGFLLISINNVNAYSVDGPFPPDLDTLYPLLRSYQTDVIILHNGTTYYALASAGGSHTSNINSNYITSGLEGTYGFNNFTNFFGISSLSGTGDVFKYVDNSWTTLCTFCTIPSGPVDMSFNANTFVYAWLKGPSIASSYSWTGNNNFNNPFIGTSDLFYINYNLNHYASVMNYFDTSSAYSYLTSPTNIYASHNSFTSDELTLNYEYLLDFNMYMYKVEDTSDENRMVGARFNYDFQNDNNYELGFILTYKASYNWDDDLNIATPILVVQAKTKTGTYKCNAYSVKVDNLSDVSYQQYVNCPSVALTSDEDDFIDIIVQGFNDTTINNNMTNINYNILFSTDESYFGISPILKRVTDIEPVPIIPDDSPDNNDIINGITDINDTINSGALPDNLSNLVDFAGYLPPGPVDSILTLPLTFMNNYYSAFTSSSCNPVVVPFPFLENQYFSLPCGNTLINNMGFINWWETIGAIFGGYCLYKYLLNLYKWVDRTLTFRENTLPDWGGA